MARGEPEVKLELDGVSAGAVMVPEGFAEAEVSCSFFSKSITIAVLPSGKLTPQHMRCVVSPGTQHTHTHHKSEVRVLPR